MQSNSFGKTLKTKWTVSTAKGKGQHGRGWERQRKGLSKENPQPGRITKVQILSRRSKRSTSVTLVLASRVRDSPPHPWLWKPIGNISRKTKRLEGTGNSLLKATCRLAQPKSHHKNTGLKSPWTYLLTLKHLPEAATSCWSHFCNFRLTLCYRYHSEVLPLNCLL